MNMVDSVEQIFCLDVVAAQEPSGATDESKEFFLAHRHEVDKPSCVFLVYATDPGWDFFTYVAGENSVENPYRKAIKMDGFSWGYSGGGCRGLMWLLEELGFEKPEHLPPAHEPGVWILNPGGTVRDWEDIQKALKMILDLWVEE